MNETVENLILGQLRELRTEMAGVKSEMTDLSDKMGTKSGNARVAGVAKLLTLLAGHVSHIEERVEKLEVSLTK